VCHIIPVIQLIVVAVVVVVVAAVAVAVRQYTVHIHTLHDENKVVANVCPQEDDVVLAKPQMILKAKSNGERGRPCILRSEGLRSFKGTRMRAAKAVTCQVNTKSSNEQGKFLAAQARAQARAQANAQAHVCPNLSTRNCLLPKSRSPVHNFRG